MMKKTERMLGALEEFNLTVRIFASRSQDRKARDRLFKHYVPLANKEAMKFRTVVSRSVSTDDLFHEACKGLLTAIDKFDPTRCPRLAPIAKVYIRDSLRVFLMNNTGVGINVSGSSRSRKIYYGIITYCKSNSIRPPLSTEHRQILAAKFDTDESTIALFETMPSSSTSMDSVMEFAADQQNPEQMTHTKRVMEKFAATLAPHMNDLQAKMFREKYLLGRECSSEKFAEQNGITLIQAKATSSTLLRLMKCFATEEFRRELRMLA